MDRQRRGRSDSRFSLEDDIFKITRQDGIIYVSDVDALSVADDTVSLRVVQPDGIAVNIIVNMVGIPRTQFDCGTEFNFLHFNTSKMISCNNWMLTAYFLFYQFQFWLKSNVPKLEHIL